MTVSEHDPSISEEDIRALATTQSFDRGFNCFRGGSIFEAVCQGNQLRAYCHGSHYDPYRVTATLGPSADLTNAHCTCPYNWGGICKHIVALLLSWIHEPEIFHSLAPLDELLANRNKEDLIALIKEMLQREPDLLLLLDLPSPPSDGSPLDLNAFRRQIDFALRHDFPDAEALGNELEAIVETANRFLDAGDWINAGALFHLILSEIVPDYQGLYDQEGHVAYQLSRCAAGLADCFSQGSPDAETRRAWLETLLEAEFTDIEIGGIDLAGPSGEYILNHATDQEWLWIEARVRAEIADHSRPYSRWGRERLVGLLVRRLELNEREAESAGLIFELGTAEQQAFLLVRLGRFHEATGLAEQAMAGLPGLVLSFADALVDAGAGPVAEQFIAGMLDTSRGMSYLAWLAEYAEVQGDLAAALDWWRQLLQVSPDLEIYQKLQEVATSLNMWQELRPQLLLELASEEKWDLLIEIALDENNVAWALQLLAGHQRRFGWSHRLRVAEAAEQEYPQAARNIYAEMVENLISHRGRGNYQMAAELLVRVRSLHIRQKEHAEWDECIAELRDRYRRLPALQDELNQAGL